MKTNPGLNYDGVLVRRDGLSMHNNQQTMLLQDAINAYELDVMDEAISKFLLLADSDNMPEVFQYLYFIYKNGDGVSVDIEKADTFRKRYTDTVRRLALAGNKEWKLKLAYMYFYGDGVPQDNKQAMEMFNELASVGHTEAQFILWKIFKSNPSMSSEEGLYWLQEAAKQGHTEAMYTVASLMLIGKLGAENARNEAICLLTQSAAKDFLPAEELLRKMRSRKLEMLRMKKTA
ncbi:tetratricopeptide repeat protein [Zooshikella sp. RANM57]|uniref:tetratricopeptide repeat protein n=1 Tax=Zooshikella sp. RANM57 TaxID=3425863 RepID=UPI003D6FCDC7